MGPHANPTIIATLCTNTRSIAATSICYFNSIIDAIYTINVSTWLTNTIILNLVNSVYILSSYNTIRDVNVMVTICTTDSSNNQKPMNIIIEPWYMLFSIQIKNVFRFSYLPFWRVWYNCGYYIALSYDTSSSNIRHTTGNIVYMVVYPNIRYPL